MQDTLTQLPAGPSTQVWSVVTEHLEAFDRAWNDCESPPDLADFLPGGSPDVRRLVLVEIVKFDLDRRLQGGTSKTVEEYIADFPELVCRGGPPCDLLYEDYHLRQQAGHAVDPLDYYRRFPGRAGELARLFGKESPARSTAVHATRAPKDFALGDRIDDFDLLALLGEGQFAKVFLARQRTMQRLVALKVSSQGGAEAETLAQLDHPNIVRVYDQRLLPDRDILLVYMPYLAGGTLQNVVTRVKVVPAGQRSGRTLLEAVDAALERRGEMPPSVSPARQLWETRSWSMTVCSLGAKLAEALDYAHRIGVLHRDIKPANVLLTAEGEPLLADFNVGSCSKLDGAGPASFFGGSLAYMSAEHLEAFDPKHSRAPESLDGRADMFGLAVTLWELLAGCRPFDEPQLSGDWSDTLTDLVERRRKGPKPEAVAALPNDLPGLKEILLRCLDPDIERRPRTAGELRHELELCLRPASRELVKSVPGGWRECVKRYPLLTLLPLGLAPNALGSLFNIEYNRSEIIDHWPKAVKVFEPITLVVNGIFFPMGIAIFTLSVRTATRTLRRTQAGDPVDSADLVRARLFTLRLGRIAAHICFGCWLIAGLIWPVALRIAAGPPPQGPSAYLHFVLSLLICGLIAVAYPYFLVTYTSIRALYPALLDSSGLRREDLPGLLRVERELGLYRAAATAVPLLAVALLASRGSANQVAVVLLSLAGLAGTFLAFTLEKLTRSTLAAITDIPREN